MGITDTMTKNRETKKIVESGYDKVALEYAKLEGKIKWPRMKWLSKLLQQLEPMHLTLIWVVDRAIRQISKFPKSIK